MFQLFLAIFKIIHRLCIDVCLILLLWNIFAFVCCDFVRIEINFQISIFFLDFYSFFEKGEMNIRSRLTTICDQERHNLYLQTTLTFSRMSLIMLTTSSLLISPVTSSWIMSESFFDISLSKFLKKKFKKTILYELKRTSINSTTFSLPLCLFSNLLFFSSRDIFRLMKTSSGPSISL